MPADGTVNAQVLALERCCSETRMAVLEDGRLCELYMERGGSTGLTGNIYAGRVQNLSHGLNAAFVDIGLRKNGFLNLDDVPETMKPQLKSGSMLTVQVEREGAGEKGPRLKCQLSIPGRYSVLLPGLSYAGVSKKIEDEGERDRLYAIASSLSGTYGTGIIVRTEAEGEDGEQIEADYLRLLYHWRLLEAKAAHAAMPCLIYANGDLVLQSVRDRLGGDVARVITDDEQLFSELRQYAQALTPQYAGRIELIECDTPLFDSLRVDHQLEEALSRRVKLKSGGNLVIDEVEALTVIDVNSAKFTGKRDARETILRLNCEAADELARQLRLRDIGGIVIVDFIDMEDEADREALLAHLREAVSRDPNRVNVLGITALGLVELTRRRVRLSLTRQLTRVCPRCAGSGIYWNCEYIMRRTVHELWRRRRQGDHSAYCIIAGESALQKLRMLDLHELEPLRIEPSGGEDVCELRLDEP